MIPTKKKLSPDQFPQAIQFSEQLLSTELWINKAEELLAAAKLLESEVLAYWREVRMQGARVVSTPDRPNVQGQLLLAGSVCNRELSQGGVDTPALGPTSKSSPIEAAIALERA